MAYVIKIDSRVIRGMKKHPCFPQEHISAGRLYVDETGDFYVTSDKAKRFDTRELAEARVSEPWEVVVECK